MFYRGDNIRKHIFVDISQMPNKMLALQGESWVINDRRRILVGSWKKA